MAPPAGRANRCWSGRRGFARCLASSGPLRQLFIWLSLWLVPAAASAAELIEIRSAVHRDFTRVVLETDMPVPYSIENRSRGSQPSVEVYFPAAATAARIGTSQPPVMGIRLEEIDVGHSLARLVVAEPVDVWTNRLSKPPRIVLDLRAAPPAKEAEARDPEDLSELDYQIVVEPGERDEGGLRASPGARTATGSPPHAERAVDLKRTPASQEPPVAAPPPPSRTPRVGGGMGWRRWARLFYDHAPWSWIALAWFVVVLVFLIFARLSRPRESDEWSAPLEFPRPFEGPRPPVAPTVATAAPPPAAPAVEPEAPPAAEPTAARPEPEEPVPARDVPSPEVETPSVSLSDFLIMLRKLDLRIARLEQDVTKIREAQDSLEARSTAQAEELRMQRATVARFGRRAERARAPDAPPPSSS